ncbi:hypothetical protein [Algoriphagus vanfongensis]|uniref:hypothetical protein n=1 Tax=Algoriphagus vanfongensis TaxID=426371 RepID=UPI00047BE71D|nr:hypothetical protein [Algoriphagus vanfongensis]
MNSDLVAIYATLHPKELDIVLLKYLLSENYDVVLPIRQKHDEVLFVGQLTPEELHKVHFFACDFTEMEDAQNFQSFLLDNCYPIQTLLVNFNQRFADLSLEDLLTEDVNQVFQEGFIPSFHFSKAILPLLDSKFSKALLIDQMAKTESASRRFSNHFLRSSTRILLENIKKENPGIILQKLEIEDSKKTEKNDFSAEVDFVKSFLKKMEVGEEFELGK